MPGPIVSSELLEGYLNFGGYTSLEIRMFKRVIEELYPILTEGKIPPVGTPELLSIVGPAGAGKSTLMKKVFMTAERQKHSVIIDPDILRSRINFFQEAYQRGLDEGLEKSEADKQAFERWNPGAIYVTQSILNRAQDDGYNLMRCGTLGGPVTRDIYTNAAEAGYSLNTEIILAPLSVCVASIKRRIEDGGHQTRAAYVEGAFEKIKPAMQMLLTASAHTRLFWRPYVDSDASCVAEVNSAGDIQIHDPSGLSELMGEASLSWKDLNKGPVTPSGRIKLDRTKKPIR
jgi:predicted ABC-type ATPase